MSSSDNDDALLALAKEHGLKTRVKKKTQLVPNDIDLFISYSNTMPDLTDLIPFKVLYYYYTKWKKDNLNNGFPQATKALFHKVCSGKFGVAKGRVYSYRASSQLIPNPFKDLERVQGEDKWQEKRYRKRQQMYQMFLDLKLEFEGREALKLFLKKDQKV